MFSVKALDLSSAPNIHLLDEAYIEYFSNSCCTDGLFIMSFSCCFSFSSSELTKIFSSRPSSFLFPEVEK